MNKVVIKTAVKTLVIVLCAALIAFVIMSFGFPQYMATLSEKTGSYKMAVRYASLRYSYTGDVADLARCAEDSLLSENNDYIIEYCSQLVEHDDFEELCSQKDDYYSVGSYSQYTVSYKQYICGKYAAALAGNGEREQAVEVAVNANGLTSFNNGNAVAILTVWAANNDSQTCTLIVAAMADIQPAESQQTYYNSILKIATNAAA